MCALLTLETVEQLGVPQTVRRSIKSNFQRASNSQAAAAALRRKCPWPPGRTKAARWNIVLVPDPNVWPVLGVSPPLVDGARVQ